MPRMLPAAGERSPVGRKLVLTPSPKNASTKSGASPPMKIVYGRSTTLRLMRSQSFRDGERDSRRTRCGQKTDRLPSRSKRRRHGQAAAARPTNSRHGNHGAGTANFAELRKSHHPEAADDRGSAGGQRAAHGANRARHSRRRLLTQFQFLSVAADEEQAVVECPAPKSDDNAENLRYVDDVNALYQGGQARESAATPRQPRRS